MCERVRACVRVRVCVCVRACVRACVRVCMQFSVMYVYMVRIHCVHLTTYSSASNTTQDPIRIQTQPARKRCQKHAE